MTIEEGDLVQLRTGGSIMHVNISGDPDTIHCSWSVGKGEPDMSSIFFS